ncbi:hypothetical protein KKF34_10075 [Myxococcota bacterium]|nr:hypothetical protein [Myxococcota bacterium]MBU1382525.1 hypothetical protein [Myxococcota bacterium]MBU1497213.1 hypothetical protein [Myxococcota bacterium]
MTNLRNKLFFLGFIPVFALPVVFSSVSGSHNSNVYNTISGLTQTTDDSSQTEKMSPEQMLSSAESMSSGWPSKEAAVQKMFEEATKKKNIMRMNCLEPKTKSVKFWVAEGNSAYRELKALDKSKITLSYQKVKVINTNIEEQVFEASRCVGDEKFSTGEGFEMKLSKPEYNIYDPDQPNLAVFDPLEKPSGYLPYNPDWSVELTWPNASPYK